MGNVKSFEIVVIVGNNFSHVHRFSSKNSKISTSVLSKGKYYFDPENDDIFLSLVGQLMTLCFPHSLFIHKILIIKYVWYTKICNLTIERKKSPLQADSDVHWSRLSSSHLTQSNSETCSRDPEIGWMHLRLPDVTATNPDGWPNCPAKFKACTILPTTQSRTQ